MFCRDSIIILHARFMVTRRKYAMASCLIRKLDIFFIFIDHKEKHKKPRTTAIVHNVLGTLWERLNVPRTFWERFVFAVPMPYAGKAKTQSTDNKIKTKRGNSWREGKIQQFHWHSRIALQDRCNCSLK